MKSQEAFLIVALHELNDGGEELVQVTNRDIS